MTRSSRSIAVSYECLKRIAGVSLMLWSGACTTPTGDVGLDAAGLGLLESASITNPTIGGPYGSNGTTFCSNLLGSYNYNSGCAAPLSTAAQVLPYLDNAAKNWGCDWNLAQNAVFTFTGGSLYKWYGTISDSGFGCGSVWWNYAKQAAYFIPNTDAGGNVALSSQGSTTYATSSLGTGYPTTAVNDGNRNGNVWGSGGGWSSSASPTLLAPQIITVQFNTTRTINAIDVVTLQDNHNPSIEPTLTTAFSGTSGVGIRDFLVQYYTGSTWVTVMNGIVTGNTYVVRRFTFSQVTATHVRLWITAAVGGNFARVVELAAYEPTNGASRQISVRYGALNWDASILGPPLSNPVPYGWSGVTYQHFKNGIITYHPSYPGGGNAVYIGGTTPESASMVAAFNATFGSGPAVAGSMAVYPLTLDPTCTTNNPAQPTSCTPTTPYIRTGTRSSLWDVSLGKSFSIVNQVGAGTSYTVLANQMQALTNLYGSSPWTGAMGLPISADANGGFGFQNGELRSQPNVVTPTGNLSAAINGIGTNCLAGSVCYFARPATATPCATYCQSGSTCNANNLCVGTDTSVLSCDDFGVCDRGNCGDANHCGSLQYNECSETCTAAGGIATTCGNMGYACVNGVITLPPMACTSCTSNSYFGQQCMNGTTSTTCKGFGVFDNDTQARYNEITLAGAHNSFLYTETLGQILDGGVRGLEFDLHPAEAPIQDWRVYHLITQSNCGGSGNQLSMCLDEVRTWHNNHPQHEVITIVFETKDDNLFPAADNLKNAAAFDQLMDSKLGAANIFKPASFLQRCTGATSLQQAVAAPCLWPRLSELRGRFLLVMTGLNSGRTQYINFSDPDSRAALASNNSDDVTITIPDSRTSLIFYDIGKCPFSPSPPFYDCSPFSTEYTQASAVTDNGFASRLFTPDTDTECTNSRNLGKAQTIWSNLALQPSCSSKSITGYPFGCLNINVCNTNESSWMERL
jgi:hypothetical protein